MFTGLIIGGVLAVVGGAIKAGASIKADREARESLEEQKKHIDELYAINKKQAEEDYKQAQDQAERNAKQTELQSDLTDLSQNITENAVSYDFNAAIDNMYLNQEADALNWNLGAMQAASSEGATLANLAGTGVRAGSSLSDAVLMESATNAMQLEFNKDAKRRSDSNNLGSILNSLAGNKFGIMQNRIGADVGRDNASYLRNSFLEGGSNFNLYELQKKEMEENYRYNINNINNEKEKHSGTNVLVNAAGAFFGGASQGFSTGYNLGNTIYKGTKYNVSVGGEN